MPLILTLLRQRFFLASFAGAFFVVLLAIVWAFGALGGVDEPIVLHFSEYSGIHRIGGISELFPFAFFGVALIVANLFLAAETFRRRRFYSYLLAISSCVAAILLFVGFAAIISVN